MVIKPVMDWRASRDWPFGLDLKVSEMYIFTVAFAAIPGLFLFFWHVW